MCKNKCFEKGIEMFGSLSKSVFVMFIYDLIVLTSLSLFLCEYFNFSNSITLLISSVTTFMGLITLYLKSSYKIREFNITFRNFYRIFETSIFTHIPVAVIICLLFNSTVMIKYISLSIIGIFCGIYFYRLGFHYYLFHLKRTKKVLVFGANERAKVICDIIKNKKALKMEVVGIVKSAKAEKHFMQASSDILNFKISQNTTAKLNTNEQEENNFKYDNIEIFEQGSNIADIVYKTNADIVIFTYKTGVVNELPKKTKYYLMTDFYEMSEGKYYIDDTSLESYAYDVWKKFHN